MQAFSLAAEPVQLMDFGKRTQLRRPVSKKFTTMALTRPIYRRIHGGITIAKKQIFGDWTFV
jgi:hypothetical protein